MALVRHPNLQNVNGNYAQGATVTAVTNRDTETAADIYTDETGDTEATLPVASGAEGELDIWVPVGSYETTFGDDTVDTPAVWEAISGEEIANMLTIEDIAGFPDYVFSPVTYGGDPTGVADSTTALQAAITAAAAVRGTVHLGNGTSVWKFSSMLNGAHAIRITGEGGGMGGTLKGAQLLYTGSGDTPAISFQNDSQWELDHVRLTYSSATFTGPYVSIHGASADCINWHIHHVRGSYTGVGAGPCMGYICGNNAIVGKISESGFDDAQNLIVLGTVDPTPTDRGYVNNIQITNCGFNHSWNDGAILISSGDAEAISIQNCYFEAGGASAHSAIRGTNTGEGDAYDNLIYTLQVSNCWFGDNAGTLDWISGLNSLGNSSPIHITNNFFDGPGTTGRIVTVGDVGAFIVFTNNRVMDDGAGSVGRNASAPGAAIKLLAYGNAIGGGGLLYDSADVPNELIRLGPLVNSLNGQLSIGINTLFDNQDFTELTGITVGGNIPVGDPYPDTPNGSLIYAKQVSGTSVGGMLTLQGRTDDVDNGVQIVAGLGTPAIKLVANGEGVAVNGKTPPATVPTAPAAATDPATTMALVNDIRTKLIAFGVYSS